MNKSIFQSTFTALLAGAVFFHASTSFAASCCGGGSASSLILPKISRAMSSLSFDYENYDGFWDKDGKHTTDAPGHSYKQYRLNLGYGLRLADNWQASFSIPYIYNNNKYPGETTNVHGLGDLALSFWYENFDDIKCVWKVNSIADLVPAAYFGASLTVPTGVSIYDDIKQDSDITGRGFYRLDGTVLLDKTIYPWNATLLLSYGTHIERPVKKEKGDYVEPYDKKLGDRMLGTVSLGYSLFLESMKSLTLTLAYSDLQEDKETMDGHTNPNSGMRKKSIATTVALATMDRDWVFKGTWSHALEGENFPKTDIISIGVSHVYR